MRVSEMLSCRNKKEFRSKVIKALDAYRLLGSDKNIIDIENDTDYKEFDGCSMDIMYTRDDNGRVLYNRSTMRLDNNSEYVRIPSFIDKAEIQSCVKHINGFGKKYVEGCSIVIEEDNEIYNRSFSLSIDVGRSAGLYPWSTYSEIVITGHCKDRASLLDVGEPVLNTFGRLAIKNRVLLKTSTILSTTPDMSEALAWLLKKYRKIDTKTINRYFISYNGINILFSNTSVHQILYEKEALDELLRIDEFVKASNKIVMGDIVYV